MFVTELAEDLDLWLKVSDAIEEAEKRNNEEIAPLEESPDTALRAVIDKLEPHLDFELRKKKCPGTYVNGICLAYAKTRP